VLIFGGLRFARGPLTLGQRIVLGSLTRRSATAIERVVPVPVGVDLDAVSLAVHALVCRHETLRTRFPPGGEEQVVDGAGMLQIRMCDSVEEARTELVADPFDGAAEWGIRVAVVMSSVPDRPRTVILCLSHLAVDTWAADLVVEDLCALLRGAELPLLSSQPLDQASSAQDSRESLALAEADAWHLGELRSGAVDPAARAVAARCRTTASVVYLAATAVGLGAGPHMLKTITHHRRTPVEMACVAPFALDMFVPVDVSGEKFDTVVASTGKAYRDASRHDPAAVRPLGVEPDLSVLVNDVRALTRSAAATVPTTFSWGEPCRVPGTVRYLSIAGDGDAVTLSLLANGARDDVPAFLHGMADLIVAAADGEVDTSAVE
jgi:hypothetical protein